MPILNSAFVILTAGIDLSVGTVMSLGSVIAALLFDKFQLDFLGWIIGTVLFTVFTVALRGIATSLASKYASGFTWVGGLVLSIAVDNEAVVDVAYAAGRPRHALCHFARHLAQDAEAPSDRLDQPSDP